MSIHIYTNINWFTLGQKNAHVLRLYPYQIHVSFHSSLYEYIYPPIDPKMHQFIGRPKGGTISLSPSVSPSIHPSICPSIYSAIYPPFSVSIKLLIRLPINRFFTDRSFIKTVGMTLSRLAQQFGVNSSWCRLFHIDIIWSSQPLVSSWDYEIVYLRT